MYFTSSRIVRLAIAAIAVAALAGCGRDTAPATPAPTGAPATTQGHAVGDRIEFARAGDKTKIGTVALLEAAAVPPECALDPAPGSPLIGLRLEIVNVGDLKLSNPSLAMSVQDAQGFKQDASLLPIAPNCRDRYPELPTSIAPGKTAGWIIAQPHQPNITGMYYEPIVSEPDSTIDNIKFVHIAPAFALITLPPLQQGLPPTPMATTTTPPATTETPITEAPKPAAAPKVGAVCDPDVDNHGTDANGKPVKCAYAGNTVAHWVGSAPIVGTRKIGSSCTAGISAIAISPDGQDMVCVGDPGTWMPGP